MADSAIWQLSVSLPTDFPPLPILMNQSERNLVLDIQDEVRKRMADQASGHAAAGHGFDHLERVLMSARTINAEVGADALIIELAVLLHDLGIQIHRRLKIRSVTFTAQKLMLQNR